MNQPNKTRRTECVLFVSTCECLSFSLPFLSSLSQQCQTTWDCGKSQFPVLLYTCGLCCTKTFVLAARVRVWFFNPKRWQMRRLQRNTYSYFWPWWSWIEKDCHSFSFPKKMWSKDKRGLNGRLKASLTCFVNLRVNTLVLVELLSADCDVSHFLTLCTCYQGNSVFSPFIFALFDFLSSSNSSYVHTYFVSWLSPYVTSCTSVWKQKLDNSPAINGINVQSSPPCRCIGECETVTSNGAVLVRQYLLHVGCSVESPAFLISVVANGKILLADHYVTM